MNMSSNPRANASVNAKAIRRYTDFLFGYCDGFAAIRLLAEKGTSDGQPWPEYAPIDDALAGVLKTAADRAATKQRAFYVVPCAISAPGNARAENLHQTCVLPADLDQGDIAAKRAHLEQHLGPASLVVASGGQTEDGQNKLHLYWRFTEAVCGEDLETVRTLRTRLIAAVDADTAFGTMTQPIRVPGSIHGKHGVQSPVRILADTGREYELADLVESSERLPRMASLPPPARPPQRVPAQTSVAVLATTRIRSEGKDGTTRFQAMSSTIGYWIRQARIGKVSLDEARTALADYNQAYIDPPWNEQRLSREFESLLRKDRQENEAAWERIEGDIERGECRLVAPEGSEDALAAEFVRRHGRGWRHVSMWGAWYRWTGKVWLPDETRYVSDLIRLVCREQAQNLKPADARRLTSAKTISAVERIASSDPVIASSPSDWDASIGCLNTPAGIVDLDTGECLPHDPAALMTQITDASPGRDCPNWIRFLQQVTDQNADLQAYLARVCGYCLTGETCEQAFFFLWGDGANGKSVFVQTIAAVLGSYAATAPLESFMTSGTGSHPTDIAGLRGKRLVSVSETEPGRAWAESRIKTITGGDPVRARLLYRDFFEFTPTFKLVVAGNHRPQLTGVGEAMRRRLHLVPFSVTIPPDQRDKLLASQFATERDGILGWMLAGLADWRRQGLAPPAIVKEASNTYFDDEDLVGQWIAERCKTGPAQRASSSALFASWSSWADDAGVARGSQKSLGEALRGRGFAQVRSAGSRGWIGLAPMHSSAGPAS